VARECYATITITIAIARASAADPRDEDGFHELKRSVSPLILGTVTLRAALKGAVATGPPVRT
jgi:hypothetical protein